jgi:hypothetical protein
MEQILCNKKAWVSWHFKKSLGPKKLVRNIFLSCDGLRVIGALSVSTSKLTLIGFVINMPVKLVVTRPG